MLFSRDDLKLLKLPIISVTVSREQPKKKIDGIKKRKNYLSYIVYRTV